MQSHSELGDVFVLGVTHLSNKSADIVRNVVQKARPAAWIHLRGMLHHPHCTPCANKQSLTDLALLSVSAPAVGWAPSSHSCPQLLGTTKDLVMVELDASRVGGIATGSPTTCRKTYATSFQVLRPGQEGPYVIFASSDVVPNCRTSCFGGVHINRGHPNRP